MESVSVKVTTMSAARSVRIGKGLTFTPAVGRTTVRGRRPRSGPVRTSWVAPSSPEPAPVAAAAATALRRSVEAEVALAVLGGGESGEAAAPLRAAVASGVAGDAEEALVAMVAGGWAPADAVGSAWAHPGADHARLVSALLVRCGWTVAEVLAALREIGVDAPTRAELLRLDS